MLVSLVSGLRRSLGSAVSHATWAGGVTTAVRRSGCSLSVASSGARPVLRLVRTRPSVPAPLRHLIYIPDVVQEIDLYSPAVEPERGGGFDVVDLSSARLHRVSGIERSMKLASFTKGWVVVGSYFEHLRPTKGDVVRELRQVHAGVRRARPGSGGS